MAGKCEFKFIKPETCPHCGSTDFKKDGIQSNRQRYRCKSCGRTFVSTTGTMFADTKKGDSDWREYMLFLTNDLTVKASSEIGKCNKNTSYLWRRKIYSAIDKYMEVLVLKDVVWFDEIYANVSKNEIIYKKNGQKYNGISRNKLAVAVACDRSGNCFAKVMDRGKPTSSEIRDALSDHIEYGSLLIHDAFHGHAMLVQELGGREIVCNTKDDDSMAKMQPINNLCSLIQRVVLLHLGIERKNQQHYLNWACFREIANSMKPNDRKKFMLKLCAASKANYKRKK